ncbi:MAG: hypothetical protein IKU09_05915 [Firmicutes bacterium]|nr:hypothetical protein [Bacillota bacterium]
MRDIWIYFTSPVAIFAVLLFLVMIFFFINRPKADTPQESNEKVAITTEDLRGQMNREREREGLYELPAINSRSGGNSYARMDTSFKSVPDFFRQLIFGKNKKSGLSKEENKE